MIGDVYRQAASVLVLRGSGDQREILLLKKPRKNDAWQLPQGGMEAGEDVTQAALRELKEEASLEGCRLLGVSEKIYQYEFPPSFRRFRPDNVRGQQIRFVFAEAPEDAEVKVDNKEIEGYVWAGIDQLGRYLKRKEYVELVRELYREVAEISESTLR